MKTPVICFADPAIVAALQRLTAAHAAKALSVSSLLEVLKLAAEADQAMYALDRHVAAIAEECQPHGLDEPVTLEWADSVLGEGVVFCIKSETRDRNFLAYFPDGLTSIGVDLPDDVTRSELLAACYAFRLPLKETT